MRGSYVAVVREQAARVTFRIVASLTSPSATAAWIQPLMWARRLARLHARSYGKDGYNILVVRLDGIGDVVMTGPFLRELRRAYPAANITLVVGPHVANLVEACPHVDRVLTFRLPPANRWWRPLSRRLTALLFARRHLWPASYDLAMVPRWGKDSYEAKVLTYLSGAPSRAGYSERSSARAQTQDPGYDRFLTNVVNDRSIKHEVQRNLELLSELGVEASDDILEVWLSDEDQSVANEVLASRGPEPLVALALGAGDPRRIWPVERFAEVGRWLTDRGMGLVVVGGPGEEALGEALRMRLPGRISGRIIELTNKATLRQTAAVLSHCSLFCGNDAGPMHLAAAVGIPVVEISCHSLCGDDLHANSPKRFGPWRVPNRIVRPEQPSDACVAGCGVPMPHCILNVQVDSVIAAIESLEERDCCLGRLGR